MKTMKNKKIKKIFMFFMKKIYLIIQTSFQNLS
jgi:hypothetical protein